jgi:crotonobetainyl-CoA:carnitine CoA-transferase CaiB-like acyl-CoA transferase
VTPIDPHHIPPNPHFEGVNYTWQLNNRNKRSIELNFKSPGGKESII